MQTFLSLVAVLLVAGCVSTASRTPPPEHYFDCDVPPGKFSEWRRTASAKALRVSGTVELIEPRHDPRWAPVANVFIGGKDGTSAVGLRAYLDWQSPDVLQFIVIEPGAQPLRQAVLSVPWHGSVTPFTLALSGSGKLKLSAANAEQTLQLSMFDAQSVQLICSTGQFKFRQVVVDEQ
jgi:hypothetical protein